MKVLLVYWVQTFSSVIPSKNWQSGLVGKQNHVKKEEMIILLGYHTVMSKHLQNNLLIVKATKM